MNTASAKNKGRRLQKEIVQKILNQFPDLTERDISSRSMGASGEDVLLSAAAIKKFPFSVEAKNQESLQIWKALLQAEENANNLTPLLVFSRNRSKTYCCLEFDKFLNIISETSKHNEQKTN